MADLGRVLERAIKPLAAALERNAEATEKMLAIAEQEQLVMSEPGPPVCPHCGKVDPEITEMGNGGSGKLGGFVIVGETHCCNKTLYAVPIGFDTYPILGMAQDALQGRAG